MSNNDSSTLMSRQALLTGAPLVQNESAPATLAMALRSAAKTSNGIHIITESGDRSFLSYADLLNRAINYSQQLHASIEEHTRCYLICIEDLEDRLTSLWGAILAGAPAVLIPPLRGSDMSVRDSRRITAALRGIPNCFVLCDQSSHEMISAELSRLKEPLQNIGVFSQPSSTERATAVRAIDPDDYAIILFTSGSTALPKLVAHTHRRILARSIATGAVNNFDVSDVSFNWMPLDHVGGLVMFHLQDVITGCTQVQCSTEYILRDPLRWMQLCDEYQISLTWAPNFAYQLVNARADQLTEKTWDLSNLRFILNGGEPISAAHSHEFLDNLARFGLTRNSLKPSWGMTETCSGVTFSESFYKEERLAPHTCVGLPIPGIEIRIVDDTELLRECGEIGRLQVGGSSVVDGYGLPSKPTDSFAGDQWFDTGDLGYIDEKGLTIVGRSKDVIVVRGVNVSFAEIESTIAETGNIDPINICVLSVNPKGIENNELLAIVGLTNPEVVQESWCETVRRAVFVTYGTAIQEVYSIPPVEFPRTSIGKVLREELRVRLREKETQPIWTAAKSSIAESPTKTLRDLCYEPRWLPTREMKGCAPSWVAIFAKSDLVLSKWVSALRHLGVGVIAIGSMNPADYDDDTGALRINEQETGDWEKLLGQLLSDPICVEHFLYVPQVQRDLSITGKLNQLNKPLLNLARAMRSSRFFLPVTAISFGCQRVLPTDSVDDPAYCTMSSIARSCSEEIASFRCRYIDFDKSYKLCPSLGLKGIISDKYGTELAVREGVIYELKLAKISIREKVNDALDSESDRWVVVGGLGGIGRHILQALASNSERSIIVLGRTPERCLPRQKRSVLDYLQRNVKYAAYLAVDTTRLGEFEDSIHTASELLGHPIDHMLYLAGGYKSNPISQIDFEGDLSALSMHTEGTANAYEVCKKQGLPRLTVFTSASGCLPGSNVATYSVVNRYQQAFTEACSRNGLTKIQCLGWSMWKNTGLSAGFEYEELTRHRGFEVFRPELGVELLWDLMEDERPNIVIGLNANTEAMRSSLWRERTTSEPVISSENDEPILDRDGYAVVDQRSRAPNGNSNEGEISVRKALRKIWSDLLDVSTIGDEEEFADLGANSLHMPEAQAKIEEAFEIELGLIELFQHTSIDNLTLLIMARTKNPKGLNNR